MQESKLALFEEKEIRRKWYNEDWMNMQEKEI